MNTKKKIVITKKTYWAIFKLNTILIFMFSGKKLAGVAGFEPTIARPKPAALPLGYTPPGSTF